jgi:hypothetical protein
MKKLLMLFVAFVIISCGKEEESFTIKGRFLNGTTNAPYQNVKIDFTKIIGTPGFTRSTDLGVAYTDDNGEFSFNYSIGINENGKLQLVFGDNGITDMLTKSGLDLARNISLDFYLSDSSRAVFSFQTSNPLGDNEVLKVYPYTGAFDTLVFSKSDLNVSDFKFHLRTKILFRAVGVERVSADTTISIFNPTFDMDGDPVINNITINY